MRKTTLSAYSILLLLASATLFAIPGSAAILYAVQSVPGSPGDIDDGFDVFVTNTGPLAVNVGAFNFIVSVDSTDVTLKKTTDATTLQTYILAGNSTLAPGLSSFAPGQTMDGADFASAPNSFTSIASGESFGLGRVFFDVNSLAGAQVVNISFLHSNNTESGLFDENGDDIPIDTFGVGTITIAGTVATTPEPRTLALLGVALAGILGVRSRRTAANSR